MTAKEFTEAAESVAAVLEAVPGLVDEKHIRMLERVKAVLEAVGNLEE